MIKHGVQKNIIDHRDWDFHKTSGTDITVNLPDELMLDANLWMPDQNQFEPIFGNPAMPAGCTDYTTADVCANQDGVLYNPAFTDSLTHANEQGGGDIRTSLLTAVKTGTQMLGGGITQRTGVFNVQQYQQLDWFDSIRYTMLPTLGEKRTISWGTPWYREWEISAMENVSIMPMPVSFDTTNLPWHNSEFVGWKTINGVVYLVNKSWQGKNRGDNGWLYFSRELVNRVMQVNGTCAFTVSKTNGQQAQRISTSFFDWVYSVLTNIFTPSVKPSIMPNMTSNNPLLDTMCLAIQNHEGWYQGSTSFRNNNPGNLRFANQIGSTGHDTRNFAIFPNYQTGYNALKNQILLVASGKSHVYPNPCTLQQFFNVYSPASDSNDPVAYCNVVASAMGVTGTYLLSNLIP